ncbi:hypothetical protein ILUMI_02548 [Ignelater luminosus]|uniref:Uncharacterized protein n=1 Tax=Ignelater luminosus TaxID=2038154 RepID=A0A8K0DGA3_IGNLU|nr:hypothetical protein ILUMI_02548 [Ignelater luminosus]
MFRQSDLTQDLKLDILHLKKELAAIREENQLLKVKIRKLQNEVNKRDKQIETLLDPRKSLFVRKVISERGASMIINLQELNFNLEKTLIEKECTIKRLQNDLQTKRLYSVKTADKKKYSSRQNENSNKCDINLPYYEQEQDNSEKSDCTKSVDFNLKSSSMCDTTEGTETFGLEADSLKRTGAVRRSISADRAHLYAHKLANNINHIRYTNNDTKAQYDGLPRDHLLSIIENLKNNRSNMLSPCTRKSGSPESDLERNELLCDTPHQEILQLQNYFMDMLSEVDQLKVTISSLQTEQDRTSNLLKQKDNNITRLAKEIKHLKRPKSEVRSPTVSRLCHNKKPLNLVNNKEKKKSQNIKSKVDNTEKVEKELNSCTYTKTEDTNLQKEFHHEVIQTRTISTQKVDDNTDCKCSQQLNTENTFLCTTCSQTITDEEEARREKFNTLMEHMLRKKADQYSGSLTCNLKE